MDLLQPKDGEPVVTVLSSGPIKLKDSHFSRPRGSSDLLRAPSRFPVPQSRVVLREISVVWHLYGGKDFGSKPLSIHAQHANRYRKLASDLCIIHLFVFIIANVFFFLSPSPYSTEVGQSLPVFAGHPLVQPLPPVPKTPGDGLEAVGVSTHC